MKRFVHMVCVTAFAFAVAVPAVGIVSGEALALTKKQARKCDIYASKKARQKTNGAAITGLIVGGVGGALLGDAVGGRKSTIIGGAAGGATGLAVGGSQYDRYYRKYFNKCASQYDEDYDY